MSHAPVRVDRYEIPRVQERVPVGHVHQSFLHLGPGIFEFGEYSSRPQVMVVLVDLPQGIADLQVFLVVVLPVLLAAVNGYAAVRAFEVDMGRRLFSRLYYRFSHGAIRDSCGSMVGMRAVRMEFDISGTTAHVGNGGIGERVEEIVSG